MALTRRVLLPFLGLCLAISAFELAFAHPEYQNYIPNGKNVIHGQWPGVGHMNPAGGGARNPFGIDFAAHDHMWTKELCEKDSDGDGLTNGEELGDPFCTWNEGQTPNRTHHITHPGFPEGHYPPIPQATCTSQTPPETDIITVNMTFSNFLIPPKQTTYACQRFNMPAEVNAAAHQIIRFDPIIVRQDIVHHLIVFSCTGVPDSSTAWECGLEMPAGCSEFVWGWALGGLPECLPAEAGIPVGKNGPHFFVIQMHYNNDRKISGARDSSGVKLHITSNLRKYDASVFDSGIAEANIAIPPGQKAYDLVADCPGYCTEQAFPESGIFVYAYLMHMHLLGSKMWTELIYANGTRTILGIVENFDFNAQAWVPVTPLLRLSQGDRLLTHCVYDSTSRNRTTYGGASTSDEMCTANIAYFPRLPGFDLCTNFTDDITKMGRCGTFDFDWDTGQKYPICGVEDIPGQAATIASSVLPHCHVGQECSGLCRQAVLTWARTTPCVLRNGLNTTLQYCGPLQHDCDTYRTLFQSSCLQLCYTDLLHPNEIPEVQCVDGMECFNFSCSFASNNKTIIIVASVTFAITIVIIGFAVLVIMKCHRFKRNKVEYVG